MSRKLVWSLAGLAAVAMPLYAAEKGVLGMNADPLQVAEWVKGQPVDLTAGRGTNTYVVDFWATWHGPCRQSIPHLTSLQKKLKDRNVVFVGIITEAAEDVKNFVAGMGDKMDYAVGVDKDKLTSKAYMGAFNVEEIPHTFVVDKEGRIVWQGHPMAGLEQVLSKVLAGTYDLSFEAKRAEAIKMLNEFCELAAEDRDKARQDELAAKLTKLDSEVNGLVAGKKFDPAKIRKQIRFQVLISKYRQALESGGDEAGLQAMEKEIEAAAPKEFKLAEFKEMNDLQPLIISYFRAVSGADDKADVAKLTRQMLAVKSKNVQMLNEVAWMLLTSDKIKNRDLKLALKFAKDAYNACDGKDASVVDTYARALADNGKLSEAVEQSRKAVETCKDEQLLPDLKKSLADYEKRLAEQK